MQHIRTQHLCRHTINGQLTSSHTYKKCEKRHSIKLRLSGSFDIGAAHATINSFAFRPQVRFLLAKLQPVALKPGQRVDLACPPVRFFHLSILPCSFGSLRPPSPDLMNFDTFTTRQRIL